MKQRCCCLTIKGDQCKNSATTGTTLCRLHTDCTRIGPCGAAAAVVKRVVPKATGSMAARYSKICASRPSRAACDETGYCKWNSATAKCGRNAGNLPLRTMAATSIQSAIRGKLVRNRSSAATALRFAKCEGVDGEHEMLSSLLRAMTPDVAIDGDALAVLCHFNSNFVSKLSAHDLNAAPLLKGALLDHTISEMTRGRASQIGISVVSKLVTTSETHNRIKSLASALEYLLTEILELSGNVARDNGRDVIFVDDIKQAITRDDELQYMWRAITL